MFEILQEHEIQDIYRVCSGVLLKVNKFAISDIHWNWVDTKNHKKSLSKVEGIKNCFKLKEDVVVNKYLHTKGDIVLKDTIIFEDFIIKPINNPYNYFYELKTTGNSFSGDFNGFNELLATIEQIKSRY